MRLVALVSAEPDPKAFAWLKVSAVKGHPGLDIVVCPRSNPQVWRLPGPGHRLDVASWTVDPATARGWEQTLAQGGVLRWSPAGNPDQWLFLELPGTPVAADRRDLGRYFRGVSYRGRATTGEPLALGADLVTANGLASTRDPRLATSNFSLKAVFALVGDEGHEVDSPPGRTPEREVWFSAGTTFRVIGTGMVEDTSVSVLHQLDTVTERPWKPLADVDQVLATYARDVSNSRAAGVVRAGTPGKFVGDVS